MADSMLDDDAQKSVDREKIYIFLDNLWNQGQRNWNEYPTTVVDIFNQEKEDANQFVREWLRERNLVAY